MNDNSAALAPLCQVVTSPPQGGRSALHGLPPIAKLKNWRKPSRNPISPPAGEMSDRTEGGASRRACGSITP